MSVQDCDRSRRDFVKLAAGTAVAAAAGVTQKTVAADSAPRSGPPAPARPRISSVSWNFHSLAAGSSPEQAIETIGQLGFEGIELIACARPDFASVWTDPFIAKIRKRLDHYRMVVPQFAMFQPVVEGLTSTDPDERKRNLDFFEAGCRVAVKLGSPIVNYVAPWARELKGPTSYLPRYYEISNPKPGQKFHIDIAPGFDWDRLWKTFIETVKACLARAKAHGLRFSIENHTHTMMHDATAFLRLWDSIRDPALGINLDVGWIALQREYPPVAIHKVAKHLMNVHMRDIDGLMRQFVHIGQGVMDFQAIAQALKQVRFQGCLSLEQDGHPGDMKATCARYLAMMKEYLA
jgi:sugar phosphate isomerase/epimerase